MACVLEQHSVALVREYLSRRGYKDALAALDKDRPRAEGDLTSRNEIMRQLKLERLVKRNRERVPPLGTMLELVVEALFLGERQLKPPSRTTPDEPLSVGVAPAGEAVSLPAGGPMAKAPPAAGGGEPAKAEESSNRGGRNSRATVDAGYRPTFSELPAKPSLAPTAPSAAAAFLVGFMVLSIIQPIEAPNPHALLAHIMRIPTSSCSLCLRWPRTLCPL